MSNSGYISMAPDIAAVSALVTTVDTVVDNIRAVDVPALAAEHAVIGGVVDAIRAVDVPALAAEHAVLSGENAAIQAVVDAIRATDIGTITAAITAKAVRGTFTVTSYAANPGHINYVEIINVTGSGFLHSVNVKTLTTNGQIRLTLDGVVSNQLTIVAGTDVAIVRDDTGPSYYIKTCSDVERGYLLFEFKSTCVVEAKQSNGANGLQCTPVYNVD